MSVDRPKVLPSANFGLANAIRAGKLDDARKILAEHAASWTPRLLASSMRAAATKNRVEIFPDLVAYGAEVNRPLSEESAAENPDGPIKDAAGNGSTEAVRWLLDHGAQVEFPSDPYGCTSLIYASFEGHLEVVKLLVEHGVDFNKLNCNGMNALSFAMQHNQAAVVEYLRSVGAKTPEELGWVRPAPPALSDEVWLEAYRAGLAEFYPEPQPLALYELLPSDPPISLLVIELGDVKLILTQGMSLRPVPVAEGCEAYARAEIGIALPADWPLDLESLSNRRWGWPLAALRQTAHTAHGGDWLGQRAILLDTADPPVPYAPDTRMTSLLLVDMEDEDARVPMPNGETIVLYTAYPLYPEERDLERREGLVPLFRAFQKHHLSRVLDPHRPSVVD